MPRINTHLHLASKLSRKIDITDLDSFFLGNAYPDCWSISIEQALLLHHKKDPAGLCNIEEFISSKDLDDFNLGYLFHLWVDNRILEADTKGISKTDCLICDTEVVVPIIRQLKQFSFTGEKNQAMQNILSTESEPVPQYSVPEAKKKRYIEILDKLVDEFAELHFKHG